MSAHPSLALIERLANHFPHDTDNMGIWLRRTLFSIITIRNSLSWMVIAKDLRNSKIYFKNLEQSPMELSRSWTDS